MCGRFDTSHLTWRMIHDQLAGFANVRPTNLGIEANDDVRPTTQQLTARIEDGEWVLERMRWGLVPFWRSGKPLKDTVKGAGDGFKLTTFNARCEGVGSAATFKGAFARRRCIIPASAWFEWTGDKGSKTKHAFARADGGVIWFGGIWDRTTTTDAGEVASFTILTGPADGWLTDFHDRRPLVLEPEDWGVWLDPTNDPQAVIDAVRHERFQRPVVAA